MRIEFAALFVHFVVTRFVIAFLGTFDVPAVLIVLACVCRMSESSFGADCFERAFVNFQSHEAFACISGAVCVRWVLWIEAVHTAMLL